MAKKVLIVSTSPRKGGNSDLLCDQFKMGAEKSGNDRTVPHYKEMTGKDFYFIATAADKKEMFESTISGLRGFTSCVPGAAVKGIVYGEGAWKAGEIKETPAMETAYKLGKGV